MDERERKGGSITEETVCNLLQRYSAKTVLKLLKEVSMYAGRKIDWNALVKNTTTGISSAREYQMLWRHLAYGQTLIDHFDHDANPLDDDSDLEYEVEACPLVTRESSVEAAACVKLLASSDYPIDCHVPNNSTIEAPLTINVPMFKVSSDSSLPANDVQGTNITIPISVQKEPLTSLASGAKRPKDGKSVVVPPSQKRKVWPTGNDLKTKRFKDGKSGVDVPPPQRRKIWSAEDDLKLTTAVQKHGEQKWVNIAGGEFKNERTPTELSLRWASIRKKGNLNAGSSAALSEARKAATRAIFLALEPRGNNLKAARQMSNVVTKTTQHESQIASATPSDPQTGTTGPPRPQVLTEKSPMNCTNSSTSMIKVAAVAAGARIATPGDVSSVSEAASRSKNVVHTRTGTISLARPPSTTTTSNQLCSNFSGNVPSKAPVSAYASTAPNLQLGVDNKKQGSSIKPVELAVLSNPVGTAIVLDRSCGNVNATTSTPKNFVTTAEVAGVSTLSSETKEPVQRDQVSGVDNIHLKAAAELVSEDQSGSIVNQPKDLPESLPCSQVEDIGQKQGDTATTDKEIHNPSSEGKHHDLSCKSLNANGEGVLSIQSQRPEMK